MEEEKGIKISHDGVVKACSSDLAEKYPNADVISIEKFKSIDEGCQNLTITDQKSGEVTTDGTVEVLKLLNSAYRAASMNNIRAGYARPRSPYAVLKERVKDDSEARAKLEALLEELNIEDIEF